MDFVCILFALLYRFLGALVYCVVCNANACVVLLYCIELNNNLDAEYLPEHREPSCVDEELARHISAYKPYQDHPS